MAVEAGSLQEALDYITQISQDADERAKRVAAERLKPPAKVSDMPYCVPLVDVCMQGDSKADSKAPVKPAPGKQPAGKPGAKSDAPVVSDDDPRYAEKIQALDVLSRLIPFYMKARKARKQRAAEADSQGVWRAELSVCLRYQCYLLMWSSNLKRCVWLVHVARPPISWLGLPATECSPYYHLLHPHMNISS